MSEYSSVNWLFTARKNPPREVFRQNASECVSKVSINLIDLIKPVFGIYENYVSNYIYFAELGKGRLLLMVIDSCKSWAFLSQGFANGGL